MTSETIEIAAHDYMRALLTEKDNPKNLYRAGLNPLERGMLNAVMSFTNNNQSEAAGLLGINRATLRRKLSRLGML